MPRIVDELPKTNRGRTRKYNFDDLYEQLLKTGKAAELVKGEDFTCSGASMRQFLYRDAGEKNLKIRVRNRTEDDGRDVVTFSVEKSDEEKPEGKDGDAKQGGQTGQPQGKPQK
jgi:hypothetical protein